jgi:hypothetical protein
MDNVQKINSYVSYNCLSNNSDQKWYSNRGCDPCNMIDFRIFGALLCLLYNFENGGNI